MIYSHKPQRSGRSIQANTNNPPQDPPPPNDTKIPNITPVVDTIIDTIVDTIVDTIPVVDLQIPDILIEDTTPPVPETCVEEKPIIIIPEKKISKPQITKPTPKVTTKVTTKVTPKVTTKVSFFRAFITKILRIFGRK